MGNVYFCVASRFYDDGSVKAGVCSITADNLPESDFIETRHYDLYLDYFETPEEAYTFAEYARFA